MNAVSRISSGVVGVRLGVIYSGRELSPEDQARVNQLSARLAEWLLELRGGPEALKQIGFQVGGLEKSKMPIHQKPIGFNGVEFDVWLKEEKEG